MVRSKQEPLVPAHHSRPGSALFLHLTLGTRLGDISSFSTSYVLE